MLAFLLKKKKKKLSSILEGF